MFGSRFTFELLHSFINKFDVQAYFLYFFLEAMLVMTLQNSVTSLSHLFLSNFLLFGVIIALLSGSKSLESELTLPINSISHAFLALLSARGSVLNQSLSVNLTLFRSTCRCTPPLPPQNETANRVPNSKPPSLPKMKLPIGCPI